MRDEASVRRKLEASETLHAECLGVPKQIYLEGRIDILRWVLGVTDDDLPQAVHDVREALNEYQRD